MTVVGSVHVVDMSFDAWSIHFGDFFFFFFTLTGSVHFVNYGLDPWWGLSTSRVVVLTLSGVRLLCGLV